jgi:hypothetical protein
MLKKAVAAMKVAIMTTTQRLYNLCSHTTWLANAWQNGAYIAS